MKYALIYQLPMWISLGLVLVGLIFSLLVARIAYGGVLFTFFIVSAAGILVFEVHHLLELLLPSKLLFSEGLEIISSLLFLAAAVYLAFRLRKIIYGP